MFLSYSGKEQREDEDRKLEEMKGTAQQKTDATAESLKQKESALADSLKAQKDTTAETLRQQKDAAADSLQHQKDAAAEAARQGLGGASERLQGAKEAASGTFKSAREASEATLAGARHAAEGGMQVATSSSICIQQRCIAIRPAVYSNALNVAIPLKSSRSEMVHRLLSDEWRRATNGQCRTLFSSNLHTLHSIHSEIAKSNLNETVALRSQAAKEAAAETGAHISETGVRLAETSGALAERLGVPTGAELADICLLYGTFHVIRSSKPVCVALGVLHRREGMFCKIASVVSTPRKAGFLCTVESQANAYRLLAILSAVAGAALIAAPAWTTTVLLHRIPDLALQRLIQVSAGRCERCSL